MSNEQAKVVALPKPIYVIVHVDGREYQGEVLWHPARQYPWVSFLTNNGFVRQEFSWGAIEQAVRLGSWLYG